MTTKADFNGEEWATVVAGPGLAGIYVAKSSKGGTVREALAMGKVYTAAREEQGDSELLDELVTSPPGLGGSPEDPGTDLGTFVAQRLREAVALVAAKATPEELETYKLFVVSVAAAAAKAHKEGGFLGIGGEQISEPEQAALDHIQASLEG